jgi:hypothetical protein
MAIVAEIGHIGDAFEDHSTQKADCAMMKTIRAPMMLKSGRMN